MGNLVLAPNVYRNIGTITAGNEVVSLPASNLLHPQPSRKWRSSALTNTYVTRDLGEAKSVNLAGLLYHNLTRDAMWRLRAGKLSLLLNGGSGVYASTPDAAALDITGDLTLIAHIEPFTVDNDSLQILIGKDGDASNRCYDLFINTSGGLSLFWTTGGTAASGVTISSTVALPRPVGIRDIWAKSTIDVDNGAGGFVVKFWYKYNGIAWTQLGATHTGVGTTSIFSGNAPVTLGANATGGAALRFKGRIFRALIQSGVDGTTVLDFDPDLDANEGDTSFVGSATGQTFTIHSTATLSPGYLYSHGTLNIRCNGGNSDNFSTPDSAALDALTGNAEFEVVVSSDVVIPGSTRICFFEKDGAFEFAINGSNGRPRLLFQTDTGQKDTSPSADIPISNSTAIRLKATLQFSGGNCTVKYYYHNGSTWVQIGTDVVVTGNSLVPSNSTLKVGAGVNSPIKLSGNVFHAIIRNGVDGPIVAECFPDRDARAGDSSFVSASTGETYTRNGNSELVLDQDVWHEDWPDDQDPLHLLHWLGDSPETYRFWEIDTYDPDNPDGYIESGVIVVDDAWQLPAQKNISYGWALQHNDPSPSSRSKGGQLYTEELDAWRSLQASIDWLDEAEMYENLYEIQRRCGRKEPVLVIRDPDATAHLLRQTIYGKMEQLAPIVHAQHQIFRSRLIVEEML